MATLPRGNQKPLVVRDKDGRLHGELGVSNSVECDNFSLSALTLLVEKQEMHPACKNLAVVCVGDDDLTGALHTKNK